MVYSHQALSGACRTIARFQPTLAPITAKSLQSMQISEFCSRQATILNSLHALPNPRERMQIAQQWLPIAATYTTGLSATDKQQFGKVNELASGYLQLAEQLVKQNGTDKTKESAKIYFHLVENMEANEPVAWHIRDTLLKGSSIAYAGFFAEHWAAHGDQSIQEKLFQLVQKHWSDVDVAAATADNFILSIIRTLRDLGFANLTDYDQLSTLQHVIKNRRANSADSRPLGVYLKALWDESISLFANFSREMQEAGMRTMAYQVGNTETASEALQEATANQKVDYLVINAHGNFGSLTWSENTTTGIDHGLDLQNASGFFAPFADRIAHGAIIYLASCRAAGASDSNEISLAEAISKAVPHAYVIGIEDAAFSSHLSSAFFLESGKIVTQIGTRNIGVAAVSGAARCFHNGNAVDFPEHILVRADN